MLAQLQAPATGTLTKPPLKRTAFQFVLEFGWFYTPSPLPQRFDLGPDGECYNNALKLVLDDDKLIYIEGFAAGGGSPPIPHAWVTDGKGRAIDNTWRLSGAVYVGVPFKAGWVSLMGLKNKGVGSVIDDAMNDFPLLRALGDEPEEWLDIRGKGFVKVK